MADDQRYTYPLVGVIICCTSIQPEIRSELSSKATSMGALHRHDLTSDVTHLIVGDPNTPKYKYVAKHRSDVKVVVAAWVDEIHEKWIAGEDVKVLDYEEKYRFPVFSGMRISVTNISDVEERTAIQNTLTSESATYHPDLTRAVTHLIAFEPKGKKYEFAKTWKLKVVSLEWFYHSLERGMALDESYYDPTMPVERRGVGARPVAITPNHQIDTPTNDEEKSIAVNGAQPLLGKRKIRDKVTEKIGGQSQSLWDDIIGGAGGSKTKKRDEWDDLSDVEQNGSSTTGSELNAEADIDAPGKILAKKRDLGMFGNILFCVYGFETPKASVLSSAIISHSGTIITPEDLEAQKTISSAPDRCFIIVPDVFPRASYPDVSFLEEAGISTTVVSFWWLEVCLHRKMYFYPEHPSSDGDKADVLCFPFETMPLKGFEGMEITLTAFTGVALLHTSKLIGNLGAKYDECFNARRTSVVIANNSKSAVNNTSSKSNAAHSFGIPVVSVDWLWACLEARERIEFDKYIIRGPNKRPVKTECDSARKRVRGDTDTKMSMAVGRSSSDQRQISREADETLNGFACEDITGVLEGCVISVSKKLKHRGLELRNTAIALGASVVDNFTERDTNPLTHFIYQSDARIATNEYNTARNIPSCHVVSPEWLNQCRTLKRKLAESGFSAYPTEITTSGRKSNIGTKQGQDTRPRRGPFLMDSEDEGEEMKEATSDIFKPLVSAQCETVDVTFTTFSEGSILRDHKENISPRAQSVESTTESISITTKAVTTTAVTELLKLGKEKLSSALDKRKKPRARLQGRATSNMSSLEANFSRASSATSSTEDQSGGATSAEKHNNSNGALIQDPDSVPPDPTQYPMSQAVSYADPEAQRERRRMIAKLNGVEAVETPRAVKTREVIQDTVTPRRTTRSHH